MSPRRPLRAVGFGAALTLVGCLSVPAAPECDDEHPCAADRICVSTRCVSADARVRDEDRASPDARDPRDGVVSPADGLPLPADGSPSPADATAATDATTPDADAVDGAARSDGSPPVDADTPPDARSPDARSPDAGPPDATPPDAGSPDATPPDAGPPDAGQPDGERCNGLDDDLDGLVDEGFDLERDSQNCGACGRACGGLGLREVCRIGECFPTGCEVGRIDENLDASDGCEVASGEITRYFVRANEPGGDGNGQGTRERPFATIAHALAVGGGNDEIILLPGLYPEAVTIEAPTVRLRADVPGTVTLSSPDERPAVTIGGYWSRVEGVTLRAPHARAGLVLYGWAMEVGDVTVEDVNTHPLAGAEGPVTGIWIREGAARLFDVRVSGVSGGQETAERDASGVFVSPAATDVTILGLDVQDIRGGDAPMRAFATRGGAARGLHADGAARLTLVEAQIRTVAGGTGSGMAGEFLGQGGDGGPATGLSVEGTPESPAPGLRAVDVTIGGLTGGAAGVSWLTPGGDQTSGADGGPATGVSLVRADDAVIRRLVMTERTLGGAGSAVSPAGVITFDGPNGRRGAATGVFVVESRRLRCSASVIDGLSVEGGSDVDPPGQRLGFFIDAASRGAVIEPTVLVHGDPALYVDGGRDVRIEGYRLVADVPATNWGRIAVRAATGVTVAGNTLTNAAGPDPWFGGEVVGLFLGAEVTGAIIENNTFGPLVAGEGALPVTGMLALPNPEDLLVVRGNRFVDLCGSCGRGGLNNPVIGVDARRGLLASNNLFAGLRGTGAVGYRLVSEGDAAGEVAISRETFADFFATEGATGVFVGVSAQPARVSVRNGIFDTVEVALRREAPQDGDAVSLDYALVWEADTPAIGATVGANLIEADPLLDPRDDYRPRPGSPAIDAGDPRALCIDEPPGDPDGMCRVDLGHTGNTGAAQFVGGR